MNTDRAIAVGCTAIALAAMVVDHLVPGDVWGFAVSAAVSLALAAFVFVWVVPRVRARAERAATVGLTLSVLSVVPGIALLWLGSPFVLAGGGIALGLRGRDGGRRGRATAAVIIGVAVIALGVAAYATGAG